MFVRGAPGIFRLFTALLATFLFGFSGLAQEPAAPPAQQTAPEGTQQKPQQKPSKLSADQRSDDQSSADQPDTDKPSADKASTGKSETKITPEQADQLFRDVDTILAFASNDTTLPIKHEV